MLQQKIKQTTLKNNSTRNYTESRTEFQNMIIQSIILGDMNAKLGKEIAFSQVVGRHTLHNTSNKNGELVANYVISNDMFLRSTNFQHRKIHTETWWSPDDQTLNQIDHVMVSKGKVTRFTQYIYRLLIRIFCAQYIKRQYKTM
jgi:hypothetical protein